MTVSRIIDAKQSMLERIQQRIRDFGAVEVDGEKIAAVQLTRGKGIWFKSIWL
jgi:hypothetical protein